MGMTQKQQDKAKQRFYEDIDNVDGNDLEYASKKGRKKVDSLDGDPPGALEKLWDDIKTMIQLIWDYRNGNYKAVPWKIIAAVVAAVIYFVSPIDFIPDFIPGLGYIDDALVIKLALDMAGEDLASYKEWKKTL
ncbi:protein of unknown function DUF1232 [Desulfohalobium retbaense DSM 5692]|uniref:DUF1232 domain-containing protein n=2 Tax=Desulfohalobium TaxID=45662 RepID=C8X2Z7_DESRD|nr:protein of unknown function DUF1232 [Desulfohalobium retbaense DSM 5692]